VSGIWVLVRVAVIAWAKEIEGPAVDFGCCVARPAVRARADRFIHGLSELVPLSAGGCTRGRWVALFGDCAGVSMYHAAAA